MNNLSIIILAAGQGTRMKSSKPKILHSLAGRPLIKWVLSAIYPLKAEKVCLIVGHQADYIKEELKSENVKFVIQDKQLGTGHALQQTQNNFKDYKGDILVLCGDTPLININTLKQLIKMHRQQKNVATILSAEVMNPYGYGRIDRDSDGQVLGIVEEKDATLEQRQIKEINSGIYCFSPIIWNILKNITNKNKKGEYYLTDTISILKEKGLSVGAYDKANPDEIMGINSRVELSLAESIIRTKIVSKWMSEGVTIIDPCNTYISLDAKIGQDTILYPGTIIEGKSIIGKNCKIGPYSYIKDSFISDEVEIRSSYIYESKIYEKVKIGPFAHIRPETIIKSGARVGNFTEIKKSFIGKGTKVNHLTYLGDSQVGEEVNVGAGTITCNYDGNNKHKTIIGNRAFIGSNVNLVAPVKIGEGALLGAGSTITDDVPANALAIARARQLNKVRKER